MALVGCGLAVLLPLAFFWMVCADIGSSPQQVPATSRPAAPACLSVPEAVRAKIESGLTVRGGGTIPEAAAARSPDHSQMYYVAAEIDGPGLEGPGHVGVWATNRLSEDGSGMMMSVDEVAKGFSDWPDGSRTVAGVRSSDVGARAARGCL